MYSLYINPPLPACIVYDCREGRGVIIGNTQSVSIPFLFLFLFHQSSLYPIKIFAKCFIYYNTIITHGGGMQEWVTITPQPSYTMHAGKGVVIQALHSVSIPFLVSVLSSLQYA